MVEGFRGTTRVGRSLKTALLGMLAWLSLSVDSHACQLVDRETGQSFVVYEELLHSRHIDHEGLCITPLTGIYAGALFGQTPRRGDFSLPELGRVHRAANRARHDGRTAFIDIEHWPLRRSQDEAMQSVANYLTVLQLFKRDAASVQVGYYGLPPIRDYWRAIRGPNDSRYQGWQAENDRLRPIAEQADVMFPSIYTFYPDPDGWLRYAEAQIAEARRLAPDKPIVAFLMPIYHPSNDELGGQPIDPDYWLLQLETMRRLADGVVLWADQSTEWQGSDWWETTLEFLDARFERNND